MRAVEFIYEALSSDDEMQKRYPDMDADDREMMGGKNISLPREPGPTLWSCRSVIQNILGSKNVTDDADNIKPGQYYMFDGVNKLDAMFRATGDTHEEAGSIEVRDLDSYSASDVGIAAHEAYHAYIYSKTTGGQVYGNEKIVNKMAEKWCRKHLTGPSLHYALEAITNSRIHYGQDNYMQKGPVTDRRE
jgi:hypothetical protein